MKNMTIVYVVLVVLFIAGIGALIHEENIEGLQDQQLTDQALSVLQATPADKALSADDQQIWQKAFTHAVMCKNALFRETSYNGTDEVTYPLCARITNKRPDVLYYVVVGTATFQKVGHDRVLLGVNRTLIYYVVRNAGSYLHRYAGSDAQARVSRKWQPLTEKPVNELDQVRKAFLQLD